MNSLPKSSTVNIPAMRLRPLHIIISAVISCMTAAAQVPVPATEGLSPNAMSIRRYGDIPVSLYTGTPSIVIPIDTLRSGSLRHPVVLSYHSGGIKVNTHPGWTGLGWTLQIGGAITREVRSAPDEDTAIGYMKVHGQLEGLTESNVQTYLNNAFGNSLFSALDTEPNKFSFNFGDYSGAFMLAPDGEWKAFCDRPLKIQVESPDFASVTFPNGTSTSTGRPIVIKKITITAENGVKYTFGGDNAMEMCIDIQGQQSQDWTSNAWYLTEIRHPNGDVITFDYERGEFVGSLGVSWKNVHTQNMEYVSTFGDKNGSLISPAYLRTVSGNNFNILLNRSESKELEYTAAEYLDRAHPNPNATRPRYFPQNSSDCLSEIKRYKLDGIEFKDLTGAVYKHVVFDYTNPPTQRLTLGGVTVYQSAANVDQTYSFEYNGIGYLPHYITDSYDHWGYYKANYQNKDDRSTDPSSTLYGLIRKIKYPTGGYTLFEFEANHYRQVAALNSSGIYTVLTKETEEAAGGARISRIINVPADGTIPEVREFMYVSDYAPDKYQFTSSGIIEGNPTYIISLPYTIDGRATSIIEESSNSLTNIVNNSGNHIGYSTVVELNPDGGYTTSSFSSSASTEYIDEPAMRSSQSHALLQGSSKSHYRGKLLSKSEYDRFGTLLRKTEIGYAPAGGSEVWLPGFYYQNFKLTDPTNSHTAMEYYKFSIYKNYIHQLCQSSVTETTYGANGSNPVTKSRYLRYNTAGQLRSDSTVVINKGAMHKQVTITDYMWEKDPWFATNSFKSLVGEIRLFHNGMLQSTITNTYAKYAALFPYLSKVTETRGGTRTLYECLSVTSAGNPVETVDVRGLHTVYVWSRDRLCPIAEIRNATAAEVSSACGISPATLQSDNNFRAKATLLREKLPAALVTDYAYTPHIGITEITDPSGRSTRFGYDALRRLSEVRNTLDQTMLRYIYSTASTAAANQTTGQ